MALHFPDSQSLFGDPLGEALLDYLQGNAPENILVKSNLVEDDAYDVAYFFRSWDEMPYWEQLAVSLCKGKILDVGSGAGCHALVLEDLSHDIIALDSSPGAVEAMKRQGIKNAVLGDLFQYRLKGPRFDTLLMLMNGLGIVGSLAGLYKFLILAKTLLQPGGQILLDSSDLSYLLDEDPHLLNRIGTTNYLGEVMFQFKYKQTEGSPFAWLYADADTLSTVAVEVGYNVEILYEGPHYEYLARLTNV